MKNSCCEYCFIPEGKKTIANYFDTMKVWTKNVRKGFFKLVVGDCPLETLETHVFNEEKYIFNHYFKCACDCYCRSGICIRSTVPILKRLRTLPENLVSEYKTKEDVIIGEDYV